MAIFPTSNLSLQYVCYQLGYAQASLGHLCQSPRINMWSKYKPVRYNFFDNRPSNWWKGAMGDCGIEYDIYDNVQGLVAAMADGPVYKHLPPTGGKYPFRLGDFAGYNPNAVPPVTAPDFSGKYYKANNVMTLNLITYPPSDDRLSAEDVYGRRLSNMYFGAAFLRQGYTTPMWITSPNTGESQQLSVPLNGFLNDEIYYGYMFLTDTPNTSLSSIIKPGIFIALPNTKANEITVQETNVMFRLENLHWNSYKNEVTGTIRVVNNSNSNVNFVDIVVAWRYGDSTDSEPYEYGEGQVILADISASPQQIVTRNFESYGAALPDFNTRGGIVWAYANGKLMAKQNIPRLPTPEG